VTAPLDAEDAVTWKGAVPNVWVAIAAKVSVGVTGVTVALPPPPHPDSVNKARVATTTLETMRTGRKFSNLILNPQ
jgi:hypothetical protein